MKLDADSREFIESLTSLGVEFLVVGGHAVAFHGHPRFTGDIDLLVRPTLANATLVLEALQRFGFESHTLTVDQLTEPYRIIQLGRPPNRIDVLTGISGVSFEAAWTGKVGAMLDGLPVWYLGLSELLANKAAAGRDKDKADHAQLLAVLAATKR